MCASIQDALLIKGLRYMGSGRGWNPQSKKEQAKNAKKPPEIRILSKISVSQFARTYHSLCINLGEGVIHHWNLDVPPDIKLNLSFFANVVCVCSLAKSRIAHIVFALWLRVSKRNTALQFSINVQKFLMFSG